MNHPHNHGAWLRRFFPEHGRRTKTATQILGSPPGLSRERFEHLLMKAHLLGKINTLPSDYVQGYKAGLRRCFHGTAYRTSAEHQHWTLSDNQRGRGYRDGFAGRQPSGGAA